MPADWIGSSPSEQGRGATNLYIGHHPMTRPKIPNASFFYDIVPGGVWEPRVPPPCDGSFQKSLQEVYGNRVSPLHETDFVKDLQDPCVSHHMNDAFFKKKIIDRRCMGTVCPPPGKN